MKSNLFDRKSFLITGASLLSLTACSGGTGTIFKSTQSVKRNAKFIAGVDFFPIHPDNFIPLTSEAHEHLAILQKAAARSRTREYVQPCTGDSCPPPATPKPPPAYTTRKGIPYAVPSSSSQASNLNWTYAFTLGSSSMNANSVSNYAFNVTDTGYNTTQTVSIVEISTGNIMLQTQAAAISGAALDGIGDFVRDYILSKALDFALDNFGVPPLKTSPYNLMAPNQCPNFNNGSLAYYMPVIYDPEVTSVPPGWSVQDPQEYSHPQATGDDYPTGTPAVDPYTGKQITNSDSADPSGDE